MNLYSRIDGDGDSVLLLHGLFGMGSNLGALARSLRDRYCVGSLDLPDHGRSAWVEEVSFGVMATAVLEWMDGQGIDTARIVGHSLGGKVAMRLALDHPDRVSGLVVADIAPVAYPRRHDDVFRALHAVVAAGCESRAHAAEIMSKHIGETGVVQFLLLSLYRGDDGSYRWRFNLDGLERNYAALLGGLTSAAPFAGPVLFIKGEASDYLRDEYRDEVAALFPNSRLQVMAGCGHWLHAEQPERFNRLVGRFLDR